MQKNIIWISRDVTCMTKGNTRCTKKMKRKFFSPQLKFKSFILYITAHTISISCCQPLSVPGLYLRNFESHETQKGPNTAMINIIEHKHAPMIEISRTVFMRSSDDCIFLRRMFGRAESQMPSLFCSICQKIFYVPFDDIRCFITRQLFIQTKNIMTASVSDVSGVDRYENHGVSISHWRRKKLIEIVSK